MKMRMMKMMRTGKTHDHRQTICRGSVKNLFKEETSTNSIMIASATSLRKAYNNHLFSLKDTTCHKIIWGTNRDFDEYLKFEGADTYIGFGGGTAIDIAKFLAKKYNARCVAIPSMLSTNAFATNKVAKVTSDNKITIDSVLPDEIWYDDELISMSKTENIYGLADAFSIYTALYDWDISKEKIDSEIYKRAWNTYMDALEYMQKRKKSQKKIFDILLEAGYVTNDYGCGRPESGSEHIVAKEIEKLVKVPHALAVVCGICIMSKLQSRPQAEFDENYRAFEAMGIFNEIRKQISIDVLVQALQNVKPREDRITQLDFIDYDIDKYKASEIIRESKIW